MKNLLKSGQNFFPKRFDVRIAAGAWCCGCFFLVQIYCSTLTSHLTSPNEKFLVNSFFEIADTLDISLTVDKGRGLDIVMQVLQRSGIIQNVVNHNGICKKNSWKCFHQSTEAVHLKRFAETLKKDGRLITCNQTSHCLEYVKGGNAVYSAVDRLIILILTYSLK